MHLHPLSLNCSGSAGLTAERKRSWEGKETIMSKTSQKSKTGAAKAGKKSSTQAASAPVRKDTKLALVIQMLSRSGGATIADLAKATKWQAHTVRSVLSRAQGKDRHYKIISSVDNNGGQRVYRIVKLDTAGKK